MIYSCDTPKVLFGSLRINQVWLVRKVADAHKDIRVYKIVLKE